VRGLTRKHRIVRRVSSLNTGIAFICRYPVHPPVIICPADHRISVLRCVIDHAYKLPAI
jgi:hypothetical protein